MAANTNEIVKQMNCQMAIPTSQFQQSSIPVPSDWWYWLMPYCILLIINIYVINRNNNPCLSPTALWPLVPLFVGPQIDNSSINESRRMWQSNPAKMHRIGPAKPSYPEKAGLATVLVLGVWLRIRSLDIKSSIFKKLPRNFGQQKKLTPKKEMTGFFCWFGIWEFFIEEFRYGQFYPPSRFAGSNSFTWRQRWADSMIRSSAQLIGKLGQVMTMENPPILDSRGDIYIYT